MNNKTALFGGLDTGPTISEANSIEQHGLVQPIVVRKDPDAPGKWLITAGERRFRAVSLLKQPTIAAIVRNDGNAAVVAIIENLQRVDLSPIEEAEAVGRLIEDQKLSQNDAGKLLGKNRLTINQLLKINSLPLHIREGARTSDVSKSILVELAALADEDLQLRLWKRAKDGNLTVADIRKAKKPEPTSEAAEAEGVRRLTTTERALETLSKGVTALQAQSLSEEERAQVLEVINKLNAITIIAASKSSD